MRLTSLILIIFSCFPINIEAQYYVESFAKWNYYATYFTMFPDKDDIEKFRKSKVIFIEAEIPEYKPKKAKKQGEAYEKKYKDEKRVSELYNSALDSFAKDIYPFKVNIKVKSVKELDKMKDKKKFAHVTLEGSYIKIGFIDKKRGLFALPITRELIKNEQDMHALLQFTFHRMENYFKRMEKGKRYNKKVMNLSKKLLNEKLKEEYANKTLILERSFLEEELTEEELKNVLSIKFKIVNKKEFNDIILGKSSEYWYLKVVPYSGFKNTTSPGIDIRPENDIGGIPMKEERVGFSSCAHFIVDPSDGTAVFVDFQGNCLLNQDALKLINSELKESNLDRR